MPYGEATSLVLSHPSDLTLSPNLLRPLLLNTYDDFLFMFLKPCQTTYHSKVGVMIRKVNQIRVIYLIEMGNTRSKGGGTKKQKQYPIGCLFI